MKLFLTILFMLLGHLGAWFAYNGQYAWEGWKRNPVLTAVILGPLITTMFWWASYHGYAATSSAWTVRFLGFATSYFVFPIMTYVILNESFMTPKTLVCIALSFLIILIQLSGNK
jgi:hypothetical protein|tara:strand:- start:4 stop:348 length:345 start_codon:yes stop_codon:yes gene_type:complete